jgi:hypothetical protein
MFRCKNPKPKLDLPIRLKVGIVAPPFLVHFNFFSSIWCMTGTEISSKKKKRSDEDINQWGANARDKVVAALISKGFGEWSSIVGQSGNFIVFD